MNDNEYKEWVKLLPTLSPEQLGDLQTRAKLLGASSLKVAKKDFGDRVVEAICTELSKLGVDHPTPITLKRSAAYASNKHKLDGVAEFVEQVSDKRIVQDALLKRAINLLYNDMLQWEVPISAHTIMAQIHRLPATINRHFPGYAASGMLGAIVGVWDQ